jgi:hypothetical protein
LRKIIKIDLKEVWYEGVERIHLAQDRVQWWDPVNMVIYISLP